MSENSAPDLSRIVGLIMENPQLIEEISSLVKQDEKSEKSSVQSQVSESSQDASIASNGAELKTKVDNIRKNNRSELLNAFKPYISSNRAKAIDSIISITNVLDAMRR